MSFLSDAGRRALSDAIETIEDRSRAEVVVVVRPVAGDYLANDLLVASGAALTMLAFLLYSTTFVFGLAWFLILPPLAALATVGLLRLIPPLRAMTVSEPRKAAAVHAAAAACFHDKGIRRTRERTGILVFVAVLEQRVEIIADDGVVTQVPEEAWREAISPIESIFHEGGNASTLATRLVEALADLLELWCEAREDDVDELPNEVGE